MSVTVSAKKTVVVTGAGGRTGGLVLQKLVARPDDFTAKAIVRNEQSAGKVQAPGGSVVPVNIAADDAEAKLEEVLRGADALVIATSAVPKIKPLSLFTVFWKKLLRQEGARPEFTFKEEQYPEQVDWLGQKKQIDAAKKAGVRKVVLVSSMGVTQPDNFLNTIGDGKILLWKRKAEEYLIASGLNYTILHPGGLIDDQGGQREIVLGVDDELLKLAVRRIPRADVAELCVQAIVLPEADNRAVDCVAKDPGDGTPTTDFADLFRNLKANCKYAPLPAGVAV
eukprot:jgi/Botrbrau1/23484/Bobra.106_1s0036.2